MVQDYTVVDLETTGLSPRTDKIIEIGAVKVRNGKVVDTFDMFINPGRALPPRIIELTGIHNEDVENEPYIEDIFPEFVAFAGDDILLGHNITFDYSFLKKAALNQKINFERETMDTLKIARRFLVDLESKSLGFLCQYYNIPINAHRAIGDAIATHELYQKLLEAYGEKEDTTLTPGKLNCRMKKETPITPRQKSYIQGLARQYQLEIKEDHILAPIEGITAEAIDIEHMSKNEASRMIDYILTRFRH